jgi:hypothetical protein
VGRCALTSIEAREALAVHYNEHRCADDGNTGCATAQENYANYLTAVANEKGFDPESFPGVRRWMRATGREPKPMEEAWRKGS